MSTNTYHGRIDDTPKNKSTYETAPLQTPPERLDEIAALLRTTFGETSRFTERYLHRQYAENPDGAAVGYNAFMENELAAHYVTLPLRAHLFGRETKGVLSLNTATSPAHQGKGLFTRLASATYERAASLGYEFVIGVANANSTPGFVKKLGFQLVCPLDVRVGIGKPRYDASSASHFRRIWSEKALRWRINTPASVYACADGALWANPGIPGMRMHMGNVSALTLPAKKLELRPLTTWIGLAPNARWSGIALPLPQRMRPSPLNLIFRDLTGAERTLDPSQVLFEAIDFDAY